MPIGSEKMSVQNPFIKYAIEAGWDYLSPDEALKYRIGGLISPLLDSVLISQLQRLNPEIMDESKAQDMAKRLTRVRPNIEGNLEAWEFIKGLKTAFVESERRERNVRFLDPLNLDNNKFHVTDEFTFSNGTKPDIRADIVFFINGIPIIMTETKSANKIEGIEEAFDDIRYYHRKGPEFVALNQLYSLTHLLKFYYGATWSLSKKWLFNWRDEQINEGDFESLCKTFVAPRRILRLLTDYILFTRKDEELSKVILRPHQMRAVERSLARAREKDKRRGLIWHTQGSGKTFTMITIAKRILEDLSFENPTVLMLVDRNELEEQLFKNLEQIGFGQTVVANSKQHLKELLEQDRRGLIVSMIHKFDTIPKDLNNRDTIFVLIDEAHRTTGGDLGNYLMGALPNATYIGFTGTPIDRTAYGKGTFKVFGKDDEKGYLDKYSIRESIDDKTTIPLNYAMAPNELQVNKEILEKEFWSLAELEGVSDPEELSRVLDKAVNLKNMLKNSDRMEKVARFVADHFKSNVEPMGFKAFLVAVDREACCLYKELLDKHLPPEQSKVVISRGGKKDSELLQSYYLSDDEEKDVRKRFRKADELPKILIVTEKLLTGFDAPILYCMYLDKPMRDHVLLQAIARVNRPYEDENNRNKSAGFVLDFVGIFDNLEKALAFDSQDVTGVIEGIEVLKERFDSLMKRGKEEYLSIIADKKADKQVEALLEHFRGKETRKEFYQYFIETQDVYEILSPDAFLRPYLEDYNELTRMYFILRSYYERTKIVDKEFLRKTAKLVQEHTESGIIQEPDKMHKLDGTALAKIAGENVSDTVKIFNLLKALHSLVKSQKHEQPYLLSIGDRAEGIAEAFEKRQVTTREALEALEKLIAELREAEKSRDDTGLSPEAFATYWFFKHEGIENPINVAKEASEAFENHPHWHSSERQEQEVRRSLYKTLINSKVESVVEIASKLIKMLRRASE